MAAKLLGRIRAYVFLHVHVFELNVDVFLSAKGLVQPFKLQPFENNLSTNVVLLVGIDQWD